MKRHAQRFTYTTPRFPRPNHPQLSLRSDPTTKNRATVTKIETVEYDLSTNAESDWKEQLILSPSGFPRPILANAATALRRAPEWRGVLAYDEFAQHVVTLAPAPWGGTAIERWTDAEDMRTAEWLQWHGLHVSTSIAYEAVLVVARENTFHPVRDYLNGLKWDRHPRTSTWLTTYMGVEDTPYARAVGEKWLISAVARAFEPGCKVDTALILEGPQALGKSTGLKTLAAPWFTDEIGDLNNKDAALQTQGVWIIEIAELASMSKTEVADVKAFLSRTTDRFRPPYGRHVATFPRQSVFAGTVNNSTYLKDETGGRRFWPVACTNIDIPALTRDRDQLWAEAVRLYRNGVHWWLDSKELALEAAVQQECRFEADVWQDRIAQWLDGQNSVSLSEVLERCLNKPVSEHSQGDSNRVARSLKALGWERYRESGPGRQWKYRPGKR